MLPERGFSAMKIHAPSPHLISRMWDDSRIDVLPCDGPPQLDLPCRVERHGERIEIEFTDSSGPRRYLGEWYKSSFSLQCPERDGTATLYKPPLQFHRVLMGAWREGKRRGAWHLHLGFASNRTARPIEDLSQHELTWLRDFAERLRQVEAAIEAEYTRIQAPLYARLEAGDPFLDDYEIDVEVTYLLRNDDPQYLENSDSILAHDWGYFPRCHIGKPSRPHPASEPMNWNEFQHQQGHPLEHEFHCQLYHGLYEERLDDPWRDIFRIGDIWVDIHVYHQKFVDLPKGPGSKAGGQGPLG